uniref:Uncharacterized protein n=1 Tax=Oryza barthii TaxID=65489 RepID=A0A0D3FBC2_9ORYZ
MTVQAAKQAPTRVQVGSGEHAEQQRTEVMVCCLVAVGRPPTLGGGIFHDGEEEINEPVVHVAARLAAQRVGERAQAVVRVVVDLAGEVVVAGGEQAREGREVVVRLAVVHVLGAVEHEDVAVGDDLQSHQHGVLLLVQAAHHEADVDGGAPRRRLERVRHAEQRAPLVEVGAGEDAEEHAEVDVVVRRRRRRDALAGGVAWGKRRLELAQVVGEDDQVEEREDGDGDEAGREEMPSSSDAVDCVVAEQLAAATREIASVPSSW